MQYDEAFSAVGKLGKAQYIVIGLTYLTHLYMGWQTVIPVFVAISVPFKCIQTCFEPNITALIATSLFDSKCMDNCQKYAYASSPSSIISTFDLACGTKNQFLATLSTSAFWVACLASCLIMGYLADRFGRRPMILLAMFLYFVFSTASIFSPHIWFYIAMRFLCGFCHGACITISFLIMAEMIDKNYFVEFGMLAGVWFPLGETLASALGLVFKNSWKHQLMAASFAILPLFTLYFLIVPESPLWLFSKGKTAKCEEVLRKIANLNNKNSSEIVLTTLVEDGRQTQKKGRNLVDQLVTSCGETPENESVIIITPNHDSAEEQRLINKPGDTAPSEKPATFIDLFKTLPASLLSISQISVWFSITLVYTGMTYAAGKIGHNVYLISTLLAIIEIPAALLCLAMKYFGTKRAFSTCLLILSAACIAAPFTENIAHGYFKTVFALIGKCLAAGTFDILYVYSPEIYPTVLRSTGFLLCSGASRVGMIMAPFVITLSYGPCGCAFYLIFGASAILSSILNLLWGPEALNKPLINTLEEFYNFAENNRISFASKKRLNQEISE